MPQMKDKTKQHEQPPQDSAVNAKQDIALPSFVNSLPVPTGDIPAFVRPAFLSAPALLFFHPLGRIYDPLAIRSTIPNIQEGIPFLLMPKPLPPRELNPAKFMLLQAKQYFCETDSIGNPIQTSYEKRDEWDNGGKEYIDTLMLVFTFDGIVPACSQFRTTKCQAIHAAKDELEACMKPEWAGLSAAHQFACQAPYPYMRFTSTIQMGQTTSKKNGKVMHLASGVVNPGTTPEWLMLKAAFDNNEQVQKWMKDATDAYAARCRDIEAKLITM